MADRRKTRIAKASGRKRSTANPLMRAWTNARKTTIVVSGLALAVIALLTFPEKVEKAHEVAGRTLSRVPRIAFALWYSFDGARDSAALRLAHELHPGVELCVISAEMADLIDDGWKADLVVTYAAASPDSAEECANDAPSSLAVFSPDGFSFRNLGTVSPQQSEMQTYSWDIQDRFLFRSYYGTDFPVIEVWYVGGKSLKNSKHFITLTDNSEHEYEPTTKKIRGGLLVWGTPDGLFHMLVSEEGIFTSEKGLPAALARPDGHAINLNWDGSVFVSSEGEEQRAVVDDSVTVDPLGHLYVTGCDIEGGFRTSTMFPGALIPQFDQSPILLCAGGSEGAMYSIAVRPEEPL